jgi:hypothetical protein
VGYRSGGGRLFGRLELFWGGGRGSGRFADTNHGESQFSVGIGPFLVLLGEEFRNRFGKEEGFNWGRCEFGIAGRVAVEVLGFDGFTFFEFADADWIDVATESATGIVALFLGSRDLAIEAAKQVHELGIAVEVRFRVVGAGEFLEQNLGEPGSGGLETDFGQIGGVVTAEEIEEVILLETVLEGLFLCQGPFEVAAGGPIGNVALGDTAEAGFSEGGDNVLVGDRIPDHAIDHIAFAAREAGDSAIAPGFAGRVEDGQMSGVDGGGKG